MTARLIGETGSKKRRRFLFLPILLVACTALFMIGGAQAVHDEGVFELEGNAVAGVTADDPANPQSKPPGGDDWDAVFNETAVSAEATSFVEDTTLSGGLAGAGDSILTGGGTKDINDFPDWLWKQTAVTSVQDKDDIEHAFAAQYIVDKSGADETCGSAGSTEECVLLYFGADRFSNSGDAVLGFWFLKDQVDEGVVDASGNGTFTGNHTEATATDRGDILIVTDFRSGGKAPSIQVYEWVASGGSASTHLDLIGGGPNPAGCTQSPPEGGKDKNPVPPVADGDNFCATANQNVVTSPWPFEAKANSGGTSGDGGADTKFGIAMLMEGGINMTALGLGDECFSTFLAESRASHSPTSTLSDFLVGTFGSCDSSVETTPQAGGVDITAPLSIGAAARVDVSDHAEITVGGTDGEFDGTVKFFLCGPLALTDTSTCSADGVQIGDEAGETVAGNNGTAAVDSVTATLTSVGRYCWRAEYSGDEDVGVPGSSDSSATECFTVEPLTPTLTTLAGDDVTLGNPIDDTATLTGTAKQPGTDGVGPGGTIDASADTQANANGKITFTLFGPGDCTTVPTGFTAIEVTVDGDSDADTEYTASFTPGATGTYTWVATYDGDDPNTEGAGTGCPDSNEEVTVTGTASLSTAQDWLPNDTATLTGDTSLTGTLTFQLYTGDNCGVTDGDAIATQLYTVDVVDQASGTSFSTDNETSFLEADSGTYSWLVTYVDDNLDSPDPVCEKTDITITD